MTLQWKCLESVAGLVAGLAALSCHGDAGVTVATAVSAAALIGVVGEEVLRTGPESARALGKIRSAVRQDLLNDIKLHRAAPADLDAADTALALHLRDCLLEKADLAASAIHAEGFPDHAAAMIVEKLAQRDPRFARSAQTTAPNQTFRDFAYKVIQIALRAALEDRSYFERFQPYILTAISQGIGHLTDGVTAANSKLDAQGPRIDAIYSHLLKVVAPQIRDIKPGMRLDDVIDALIRFDPAYTHLRDELGTLRASPTKPAKPSRKPSQKSSRTRQRNVPDFVETLRDTVSAAEKAFARNQGFGFSLSSGFAEIDALIGGLRPADLLILAGRNGMGKLALATNIAFQVARTYVRDMEAGKEFSSAYPVLFFSLQVSAQEMSSRILAEQCQIDIAKIRSGSFDESEWEKFVLTMQDIASLPLYIDDSAGASITQIIERAEDSLRHKRIGLIVIDNLQLVVPAQYRNDRAQELTDIANALKALARELNLPIIALSQLPREIDHRANKRPMLADLRECGSLEQIADVVMFLYREAYYFKAREPEPGTSEHRKWQDKWQQINTHAELLVEKNRHGETAVVDLAYDERYHRFANAG